MCRKLFLLCTGLITALLLNTIIADAQMFVRGRRGLPRSTAAVVKVPTVQKLTSAAEFNWQVEAGAGIRVVKFGATWCGACVAMEPYLETIATSVVEANPRTKLGFYSFDIDMRYGRRISNKYNVTAVPVTIIFVNGKEQVRVSGYNKTSTKLPNTIKEIIRKHGTANSKKPSK